VKESYALEALDGHLPHQLPYIEKDGEIPSEFHSVLRSMRLVKVKRNQEEKTLGNRKLVLTVLSVCETTQEEDSTTLDIYQIYNVTEVWNLDPAREEAIQN
jgi:hypothetical protein